MQRSRYQTRIATGLSKLSYVVGIADSASGVHLERWREILDALTDRGGRSPTSSTHRAQVQDDQPSDVAR